MDNEELKELKGFIADLKAERAAVKEKEKREAWTKYVSLTVVIIAVLASIAAQWCGCYGGRVAMSQAMASDSWNLYQARSLKGHLLEVTTNLLAHAPNAGDPAMEKLIKSYSKEAAHYEAGKDESQRVARAYEEDRDAASALGGKIGPAIPLFTISIAMASVCLLTKKKPLWLLAMLVAAIATVTMVSARLAEKPLKGPAAQAEAEKRAATEKAGN